MHLAKEIIYTLYLLYISLMFGKSYNYKVLAGKGTC